MKQFLLFLLLFSPRFGHSDDSLNGLFHAMQRPYSPPVVEGIPKDVEKWARGLKLNEIYQVNQKSFLLNGKDVFFSDQFVLSLSKGFGGDFQIRSDLLAFYIDSKKSRLNGISSLDFVTPVNKLKEDEVVSSNNIFSVINKGHTYC